MHWHARFKQWLDQWLGRTPPPTSEIEIERKVGAIPDAATANVAAKAEAERIVVDRVDAPVDLPSTPTTARTSAVWSPAPPEAEFVVAPAPLVPVPTRAPRRRIDLRSLRLALQGGGAHGAFTWGVLDRLLDEDDLVFPSTSGASAGALNGAMLVSGCANGGRAGAQKALARFWDGVAGIGALVAPLQTQQMRLAADFGLPHAEMMQTMLRMWSPAQLNPFNLNPLRKLLEELIDVEALQQSRSMRLHVAATNVETGQPRIFSGSELSIDALIASACLPFLHHAVTIDGVAYWDGGYSSNPPLVPLVADAMDDATGDSESLEILLVQINPEHRPGTPATASEIMHRVNEITFNASLLAELRALKLMQKVAVDLDAGDARSPLRLHRIALHDEVADAKAATAASLDGAFHRELRDHGRRAADRWLMSGSDEEVLGIARDAAKDTAPVP